LKGLLVQTKTIVIGCLALVLLGGVSAACAVGGIFLLGLNSEAEQAENAGVEFGKSTDQRGCLDEALKRLRAANKSGNFIKQGETQLFLDGCFQTSRATPDFCADAPKEDAFFTIRKWSQERCQQIGAGNDDDCVLLFIGVSNVCLGKTKHKPEN
jgi:hypothetical protein